MNNIAKPVTIVVADDDPDDRLLIKEALAEVRLADRVDFVEDGKDLLDYLRREGKYTGLNGSAPPDLILLDLDMPHMDGREALLEIGRDATLKRIPIVLLTGSDAEQDFTLTYDAGANSFIKKTANFERLVKSLRTATEYWLDD